MGICVHSRRQSCTTEGHVWRIRHAGAHIGHFAGLHSKHPRSRPIGGLFLLDRESRLVCVHAYSELI